MRTAVKLLFAVLVSVGLATFAYIALQPISTKSIAKKGFAGAPSYSIQATLPATPLSPTSPQSTLNDTTGSQTTVWPSSIQPTAVQVSTAKPTNAIEPSIILPGATQPTRGQQGPTQSTGGQMCATQQTGKTLGAMQHTGGQTAASVTQFAGVQTGASQPIGEPQGATQATATQPIGGGTQPMTRQPTGGGPLPLTTQPVGNGTQPTGGGTQPMSSQPPGGGPQPLTTQPIGGGTQPTGCKPQPITTQPTEGGPQHLTSQPIDGGTQLITTQPSGGGTQPTGGGLQSTGGGTQPTAGGPQSTAGGTQPTGDGPQPTGDGLKSTGGGTQPTGGGTQSTVGGTQSTGGGPQPTTTQPTGGGTQQLLMTTQPTWSRRRPTGGGTQPMATQPSAGGGSTGFVGTPGATNPFGVTARTVTTSQPPDPCLTNNGGCSDICIQTDSRSVECLCPTGKMLQSDMKTCQDCPYGKFGDLCAFPCPCDNNATCDAVLGTCVCPASFTGHNCSTSTLQCSDGYCMNGGTCSVSLGTLTCTCTVFWEGSLCESPRPIPPACFTATDLHDCLTRFLVSSDDDGSSGGDGTSELSIYIAVGTVVPLVVAALVATVVFLWRRSSQENEGSGYRDDTSVVHNSAFEQVSGLDCTRNATNSEDSSNSNPLNQSCNDLSVSGAGQEIADRCYITSVSVAGGSPNTIVFREQLTSLPPLTIDNTLHILNRYQSMGLPAICQMSEKRDVEVSGHDAPDERPIQQKSHVEEI